MGKKILIAIAVTVATIVAVASMVIVKRDFQGYIQKTDLQTSHQESTIKEKVYLRNKETKYDSNGNILEICTKKFDSNENVVEEKTFSADMQIESRDEYEYDADNRLIKHTGYGYEYELDSNGKVKNEKEFKTAYWEYCYDNRDNRINKIYLSFDEKGNILSEWHSEYECKANGKEIDYFVYKNGEQVSNETKEYDESGNLVREAGSDSYTDRERSYVRKYEYDNEGREILYISYKGNGELDCRRETIWDEVGNPVKTIYYNSDGKIEFWIEDIYEIDRCIQAVRYNADGSLHSMAEYIYDSNGEWIGQKHYTPDSGWQWFRKMEYDAAGNIVKSYSYVTKGELSYYYVYEYELKK